MKTTIEMKDSDGINDISMTQENGVVTISITERDADGNYEKSAWIEIDLAVMQRAIVALGGAK